MGVYGPHPAKALLSQDIPIPDVLRSVQVCISPVATGHTLELAKVVYIRGHFAYNK
jgi:hypothetical protein